MKSRILEDYEILIRFDQYEYMAYCPQLNVIFKNKSKEMVIEQLTKAITEYIRTLPLSEEEQKIEETISFEKQLAKEKIVNSLHKVDKLNIINPQDSNSNDYTNMQQISLDQYNIKTDISFEELDGLFFNVDIAI